MLRNTTCYPLQKLFFVFLVFLVSLTGCRKSQVPGAEQPYQETSDLVYGNDSLQRYDLFLPQGRNLQTKIILLIHGGGWVSGSKQDCDYYAMKFAHLGFAAISMNYRLANDTIHCQEMLADIDSMIACISKNAGRWGIGSDHLSLFGYSAGGHLALLYSYSRNQNRKVTSVISIAGPTNVQDSLLWYNPWLYQDIKLMAGDTIPGNWTKVSPVDFISATNPPTLLIHGINDSLVPVSQSENLVSLLQTAGAPVKLLLLDHETHFFSAAATGLVIDETANFISPH